MKGMSFMWKPVCKDFTAFYVSKKEVQLMLRSYNNNSLYEMMCDYLDEVFAGNVMNYVPKKSYGAGYTVLGTVEELGVKIYATETSEDYIVYFACGNPYDKEPLPRDTRNYLVNLSNYISEHVILKDDFYINDFELEELRIDFLGYNTLTYI